MQYQQANQNQDPYGQVSANQGGYFPQNNVASQQYPPQYPQQYPQQQYQQPYLDPNIPVGSPVYAQQQPVQAYGQQPYYAQQQIIVSTCIPVSRADGIRFPTEIICPYCTKRGVTIVSCRVGDSTICASILILLLCWPLFWLPCVLDDCKDRVHQCPSCMQVVGRKDYDLC